MVGILFKHAETNTNLYFFYKMINGLTPSYLTSIVPPIVSSISSFNLRNSNNLTQPSARTTLYNNSFLPSVTRAWNSLPLSTRQSTNINQFKRHINRNNNRVPKYYYYGNRQEQCLHTRIRTNCSSLNEHLFNKNVIDSPLCTCGDIESSHHFLLKCRLYNNIRTIMINSVSIYCEASLDILLFGSPVLNYEANCSIFDAVYKYIQDSKRF